MSLTHDIHKLMALCETITLLKSANSIIGCVDPSLPFIKASAKELNDMLEILIAKVQQGLVQHAKHMSAPYPSDTNIKHFN